MIYPKIRKQAHTKYAVKKWGTCGLLENCQKWQGFFMALFLMFGVKINQKKSNYAHSQKMISNPTIGFTKLLRKKCISNDEKLEEIIF